MTKGKNERKQEKRRKGENIGKQEKTGENIPWVPEVFLA